MRKARAVGIPCFCKIRPVGGDDIRQCVIPRGHGAPAAGQGAEFIPQLGTVEGPGVISGQLPVHHETGAPMADGIVQQTKDALHNVELVLKAAGCGKENVVLCRVYIPDVSYWDTVNEVYGAFFGNHKPARVIVPTRALHNGALIEIEAVAELATK